MVPRGEGQRVLRLPGIRDVLHARFPHPGPTAPYLNMTTQRVIHLPPIGNNLPHRVLSLCGLVFAFVVILLQRAPPNRIQFVIFSGWACFAGSSLATASTAPQTPG